MWRLLTIDERIAIAGTPDIGYERDGTLVLGFPYVEREFDTEWIDHSEIEDLFDLEYLYGIGSENDLGIGDRWYNFWYVVRWETNQHGVRMAEPLKTYFRYDEIPPLYDISY